MTLHSLPVAIIGGGPVGLAAAAQLVKRGKPFLLFEAASRLGANFLEYGHVRLFSPWRYNMDKAAASLLEKHGAALPDPDHLPLGRDIAAQYLQPLGELPEIKPFVHNSVPGPFLMLQAPGNIRTRWCQAACRIRRIKRFTTASPMYWDETAIFMKTSA